MHAGKSWKPRRRSSACGKFSLECGWLRNLAIEVQMELTALFPFRLKLRIQEQGPGLENAFDVKTS